MHSMFFLFLLGSNFFIAPLFGAGLHRPPRVEVGSPRVVPVSPGLHGRSGRISVTTLGEGAPISDTSSRSSSSLSSHALPPLVSFPFAPGRRTSLQQDISDEYPLNNTHEETGISYCFAGECVRWKNGELPTRSFRLSEIERGKKEHASFFDALSREEQNFLIWVAAIQMRRG